MKLLCILMLAIFMALLLVENFRLEKAVQSRQRYRSNIPREEMSDLLMKVTGGDIAVYIPGDTSVMPYLIKDKN